MKGIRSLLVIGVAVMGAGFVAWEMRKEWETLEANTQKLRMQREDRERRLADVEQRLESARAAEGKAQAALEALSKAAPGALTKSHAAAAAAKSDDEGAALTLSEFVKRSSSDEKLAEQTARWLISQREALGPRYASLFRELGLTAAQQEAFKDNLMRRDEQHQDLNAAALAQGYNPGDGPIAKLRGVIYADYEAAQRALLGATAYGAMVEFDRTSSLQGVVGALAGTAAMEGQAFTPGQTRELVRMIAEASSSYRSGGSAMTTTVDWVQLRARLPSVLSEAQVKIVTTMEPPVGSGGLLHAEWNTAVNQATKTEKEKKPGTTPTGGR